jgi:hypothetical protein
MSEVKTCEICGTQHSRMGYYCKKCDTNRFQTNTNKLPVFCRNCGKSVTSDICTACGFEPLNGENYCQDCGAETKTGQKLCIKCKSQLFSKNKTFGGYAVEDKPDFGVAFISFLIPLIGLILYLVWVGNQPKKAGSAGRGAIWGVTIGLLGYFTIILLAR